VRVALVCPYSLSIPGGVQGQVLGLAQSLRDLGIDARLLAPCDGPPPDSGVIPLGKSMPLVSNGSVAPIAPDAACALRTIRVLRDERFDVVHLHEPLVPGPTTTALLCCDRPMVGTFHRAGHSQLYDLEFVRPAARWMLNHLSLRCAVSELARETATEAVGGSYELSFNGIDVERSEAASPWPTEGPTILFIGRHEERKGLAVLIQAMAQLGPEVRLWVAGDGPQTDHLTRLTVADNRIIWLGTISESEKRRRLKGADVLCAPSLRAESFGVVLLEAMAASTAVVASDIAGYRTVARSQVDATLVSPGDVDRLAKALLSALSGGPAMARQITAARQRVEEFSMRRLALLYLGFYERVLA
jgi:phosphatidylinositol alpha-mannosyltransferase